MMLNLLVKVHIDTISSIVKQMPWVSLIFLNNNLRLQNRHSSKIILPDQHDYNS